MTSIGNHTLPSEMMDTCDGLFYCLADWARDVTSGFWWIGILLAFQIVLLVASIQRFGTARSFGFATVVGALGAIWLATAQLISWPYASMFILGGGVGIAVMLLNEK